MAKWSWVYIEKLWGINILSGTMSNFSIIDLLKSHTNRDVKEGWKVLVAAVLWTIWLGRNEWVFKKIRLKEDEIKFLITIRVPRSIMAGIGGFQYNVSFSHAILNLFIHDFSSVYIYLQRQYVLSYSPIFNTLNIDEGWFPPDFNTIKINIFGSSSVEPLLNGNSIGIVVLARDAKGKFSWGFIGSSEKYECLTISTVDNSSRYEVYV
ncbi:hypothetical protein POM88_016952 [Heracleum sosnowskyi]|uniref:Uncharacterized protein n=1 Tax=Heracleum sosnowskyi TaxID=360622 RepID=A0AAD8MXK3_9APIA|nr:hypothetical protein POM88_016952 [Heracleum sosnowskyi]